MYRAGRKGTYKRKNLVVGHHSNRRLTSALQKKFDSLLFTYPIRGIQGKAQLPSPAEQLPPNWQQQYEHKYGDGHWEYRKGMLEPVLRELQADDGVNLEAVCEILSQAKQAALLAALSTAGMGWLRSFIGRRDRIRGQLAHWANEAILFLQQYWPDVPPDRLAPYQAVLVALKKELLLNPSQIFPSGKHRHPKTGHPSCPWNTTARRALTQAGVPKEVHEDLFKATGLISLSPSDLSR
jgi:hypothetical protein